MSQADVVFAFVKESQDTYVAFAKRGGASPRPYVNVFGPSHDPRDARTARVVVEHDGAISFKDASVATALGAQPRSEGEMAPGTGAATWELSRLTIEANYPGPDALVRAIIVAMRTHASW
jgi:hypothetical protein